MNKPTRATVEQAMKLGMFFGVHPYDANAMFGRECEKRMMAMNVKRQVLEADKVRQPIKL